jgi:signal transduction histidine kinase
MASLNARRQGAIYRGSQLSSTPRPSLETFYKQLVADFPVGMAVIHLRDPLDVRTWRVLAVNALASQEIGSSVEEILAIPAIGKNGNSHRPNPKLLFRQIVSSNSPLLLGYVGGENNRSVKRFYALTAFPLAGDCVGLLLQDATRRVNTQWDMLQAKMQLRQMTETLRAILWRANPETLEFTYISKEAESVFGYWIERWYKETNFWKNHTVPEDWELVSATCAEVARDGGPRQFECKMLTAHGEPRLFRILVRKTVLPGNRDQLNGVMTDITDEKRVEEAARQLSSQLLRLQDQERKKMSRELHDSLGQYLTGLKINLGILDSANGKLDENLRKVVVECMSLVKTCMNEVRDVSSVLHPPMLEELGLASAIRWHAREFGRRSGLKFHLELPEEIEPLSPEVQLALFRIAQECLTNVYKHAQTDSATLRLAHEPQSIVLQVQDHGVGIASERLKSFEFAQSTKELGLRGMRERIHELGGKFEISSNGKGTTIRSSIPLQAALAGKAPAEPEFPPEQPDHAKRSRTSRGMRTAHPHSG